MILLLSDGGLPTDSPSKNRKDIFSHSIVLKQQNTGNLLTEVINQLEIRDEKYILYFPDIVSAGTHGRGNAIISAPNSAAIADAIRSSRASALIDTAAEPFSALTAAAVAACRATDTVYIKCVGIEPVAGVRLCLPYEELAAELVRRGLPVVFYAAPEVVRLVAGLAGKDMAKHIFVPVKKAAVFDTAAALRYGIPLLNVIERDNPDEADEICDFAQLTSADMLICDGSHDIAAVAAAGAILGIPVIRTHRFGAGLENVAATARDAVISARTQTNIGE